MSEFASSSPRRLRIYDVTGERRRYLRSAVFDEWLQNAAGRLPQSEIQQVHNDLLVFGKASITGGLGHRFEYELA